MLIRYKGGKTSYKVPFNRIPYIFSIENNRTLDIKDQVVINYIFSLPNRAEFEVIEKTEVSIPFNGTGDIVDLKPKIIKKVERHKKGGK